MSSFKKYSKAELQSSIDELFKSVLSYRSSAQFFNMIAFCARFRELSPFNAFLVQQQCPGARYVLTEKQWKQRYNRVPCPNARPLIILKPFGPINYVFEIADTQPANPFAYGNSSINDILQQLEAPYQTKGHLSPIIYDAFKTNLACHGIALDTNFRAGSEYGAEIRWTDKECKSIVNVAVSSNSKIDVEARFLISVNKSADLETRFASICHELAHLFCYHILSPYANGWQCRKVSHVIKEFEAETAAWLVCDRLNIYNPSEKYLAQYLNENSQIPDNISVDRIFFAANQILEMTVPMHVTEGMLYAFDHDFKQLVDRCIQEEKAYKAPTIAGPSLFDLA